MWKLMQFFFRGLFHNSYANASLLSLVCLLFQSLLSLGKSFSFFMLWPPNGSQKKKSFSSWGWWFCCCHPKASLLQTLPLLGSIVSADCLNVIIWLVPVGPLLGLLYAFLLLHSSSLVLSLGLNYVVLGFLGPFHPFGLLCPVRAPLSHFILLGLLYAFLLLNSISPVPSLGLYYAVLGFLGPFHRFWALLSHLGSFVPFYSFGHPRPISSLSGSFVPFGLFCPFFSFGHPQPVSSLLGYFVPFVFPCARLLSLGFLGSFPNFALPWAFTNFIGLPRPNYLILILGAHGLAINPLLSLFSLLWACRGPFSLFHIIYCPWFAFSLFPGSFRSVYFFKTHLFISWACDPLFLPFELNGFLLNLLTLFFPYCWAFSCYWAP